MCSTYVLTDLFIFPMLQLCLHFLPFPAPLGWRGTLELLVDLRVCLFVSTRTPNLEVSAPSSKKTVASSCTLLHSCALSCLYLFLLIPHN